jgi:hypothetical protein
LIASRSLVVRGTQLRPGPGRRQRKAPPSAEAGVWIRILAVAGVDLGAAGTAMVEVPENLEAILEYLVRLAALHVHDEADAAGIVLRARVVSPGLGANPPSRLDMSPYSASVSHK